MKFEEFAKLVAAIKTYYPRDNMIPSKEAAELWYEALKDLDYIVASEALKKYVMTNRYPVTISDIREYALKEMAEPRLNEMQAWALVSKALRNGGYHAEEEFNKLPPVVQKAVGTPDMLRAWAMTDEKSVENVIQSNFMRAFQIETKREHDRNKIKPSEADNWRRIEPQAREGISVSQERIKAENEAVSAPDGWRGELKRKWGVENE